jgi:hypothetical protein
LENAEAPGAHFGAQILLKGRNCSGHQCAARKGARGGPRGAAACSTWGGSQQGPERSGECRSIEALHGRLHGGRQGRGGGLNARRLVQLPVRLLARSAAIARGTAARAD